MSDIYDIDFDKIINWFLPHDERKPQRIAHLRAITNANLERYRQLEAFIREKQYELQHNNQVIYLEKVLNEKYAPNLYDPNDHVNTRQIYISDGDELVPPYLATVAVDEPVFEITYLASVEAINQAYTDYYVNVPSTIAFEEDVMRALIDIYNEDPKIYKIRIV